MKDKNIKRIAVEELKHMVHLKRILAYYDSKPSIILNSVFFTIGHVIQTTCAITPHFMLNKMASILEVFNVVSYSHMKERLPLFAVEFEYMAKQEKEHEDYFNSLNKKREPSNSAP
jgi:rubrerythrin